MKRRAFLRAGFVAAGAPAVMPLTGSLDTLLSGQPHRSQSAVLKLSSNENPLGVPPSAREAIIGGIAEGNRYPGESRSALARALARLHGVQTSGIVLGNGSTEVLQMAVQCRVAPDLTILAVTPTFEDVFEYSAPHPLVTLKKFPLTHDFAHDLEAMEAEANRTSGTVLVYVCNPNNPTGSLTSTAAVQSWIERAPDNVHFLVDEAYIHFVESDDYWSLDKVAWERPNVVVARTFSKVYGMAGLRVGYAVAHPEAAALLQSFAAGTNVNHLGLVAARAALGDEAYVSRSIAANAEARRITYDVLNELGLEYIPSHTNFVMHRIPGELREYNQRMRDNGIRVGRPFPPMLEYSRLSLGLPSEMERFAETLMGFRNRGWV